MGVNHRVFSRFRSSKLLTRSSRQLKGLHIVGALQVVFWESDLETQRVFFQAVPMIGATKDQTNKTYTGSKPATPKPKV